MTDGTVIVAGHLCVDLAPTLDREIPYSPGRLVEVGPLSISLGGAVGNAGAALESMGVPTRTYASVGTDELAEIAADLMSASGIDPSTLISVDGEQTSYSVIVQPAGGDRSFWHHPGSNVRFTGEEVEIRETDQVLHLGYPPLLPALVANGGLALAALLSRAVAVGVTTSLDLAVADPLSPIAALDWNRILRAALPLIDVFSPSLDDVQSLIGSAVDDAPSAARWAVAGGAAIAVVSSGPGGMHLQTGSAERFRQGGRALAALGPEWIARSLSVSPPEVGSISTTSGAGDAASAGLLAAILLGATPEAALEIAMGCAAAVMTGQRPTRAAIASFAPSCRAVLGLSA